MTVRSLAKKKMNTKCLLSNKTSHCKLVVKNSTKKIKFCICPDRLKYLYKSKKCDMIIKCK